jgi:hypothetical protein
VLLTNLVILGAAFSNRRGGPQAELRLTERELTLPSARQQDDSALFLRLRLTDDVPDAYRATARWRGYQLPAVDLAWLDRDKLRELGCRTDVDPADPEAEDHYRHAMTRRAFVVLEYEGPAWERWIADRTAAVAELALEVESGTKGPADLADAEAVLALDRAFRSRLFPIDAGTDVVALRRRHAGPGRYVIVPAIFHPRVLRPDDGPPRLTGVVQRAVVSWIHVPLGLRDAFEGWLPEESWDAYYRRKREEARGGWPSPTGPRFAATLALGRRMEPWLVDVTPADAARDGGRRPGAAPGSRLGP